MQLSRYCRLGPILCACALIFCCACTLFAVGESTQLRGEAPLFPTRQNIFDIPFQIPAPIPGQEPVEVQLHVSENLGGNWTQHMKVAPQEGKFSFRAAHDGEYWFLVRTLNKAGKLLPDEPFAAELRVLVDTVPPTIKLTCESKEPGKIRCTYSVADPLLKAETIDVACRGVEATAVWKPRTIEPTSTTRPTEEFAATATFDIGTDVKGPLFVRVTAADGAGNVAAEERQIEVQGLATLNPNALPATPSNQAFGAAPSAPWSPPTTPGGTPAPTSPNQFSSGPWRPSAMPSQAAAMPPRETIGPPPRADGERTTPPPSMARAFPGRETPPGSAETIPPPSALGSMETVPPGRANVPFSPASKPNNFATPLPSGPAPDLTPRGTASESIGPGDAEALPIPTPTPSTSGASSSSGVAAGPSFGDAPGGPQFSSPGAPYEARRPAEEAPKSLSAPASDDVSPAGVRPRLVNSRRFELDYDIESVGTAGVAKVELFGTRDGGKSWNSLGNDPDSTSPFVVNVDGEGTYGFRMVIESTTGLRSPAPQAGELPEVWVGVDVTKPATKLVSAVPGVGEQAGELDIRWEATDDNLASRPVSLAYAQASDGPWSIIASGLPNQGHYAWRMDSRTPGQLYLKLDVRDDAGNVGTYVTPEPIAIERVRPQGKIRGVRPIGESARLRMPAELPVR